MTLAELIAELERRAVEHRQLSATTLQMSAAELDPDAAIQVSMQHDIAAEAYEAALALARQVEQ